MIIIKNSPDRFYDSTCVIHDLFEYLLKYYTKIGFAVGMTYGHLNLFQTEIDIAQVESVQRNQAEMEGQD